MKRCVVTGATGFVGSGISAYLASRGWEVEGWSRQGGGKPGSAAFRLGAPVDPATLRGADALVHCAYDFAAAKWNEIAAINVAGSIRLLEAAREAGVKRMVYLSSLSAFPGCRSWYGKAKLQVEEPATAMGAWVIRPGLVYGPRPGGVFGRLVRQVRRARVLPVLQGGRQWQYLVHEEDLAALVHRMLEGSAGPAVGPISIAHERAWLLSEILRAIASALNKRVRQVPVPWQAVWLALWMAELLGVRTAFRTDNLISLIYQNPSPDFSRLAELGVSCRPFAPEPAMLSEGEKA